MPKRTRPAQGNNSDKKIVKLAAGGTNEKVITPSSPRKNGKRGFAS